MIRFLVTLAFCILTIGMLQAQMHPQAWFRTTLSYSAGPRLRAESEIQHRRQSGYDNRYLPDKNLLFSFRQWLTYQCDDRLSLSLSPLAYFTHYQHIDEPADASLRPSREFRISAAMEWRHPVGRKIHIVHRSATEYRLISGAVSPMVRFRYRTGLSYTFTNALRLSLTEEVFLYQHRGPEQAYDSGRIYNQPEHQDRSGHCMHQPPRKK